MPTFGHFFRIPISQVNSAIWFNHYDDVTATEHRDLNDEKRHIIHLTKYYFRIGIVFSFDSVVMFDEMINETL